MKIKNIIIFLAIFLTFNIFNQKVLATSINPSNLGIVANDIVQKIVIDGNQAYISGNFTKIGPSIGQMGMFNLSDYSLVRQPKPNGAINMVISDGSDG